MEKLNIDKVAKLAHVSRSVVSRVINNHPNVSDEARKRVMEVVEKYNYKPNAVARSLATKSTRQINVLTSRFGDESLGNGYWTLLYLGIFEECVKHGYYVRLSFYSPSIRNEMSGLILNEDQLDGLICLNEEVTDLALDMLEGKEIPIVLVGHNPKFPEISSVDVDNYAGAMLATSHLLSLGHQTIGAMFGNQNNEETEHRMRGFQDALKREGLTADRSLVSVKSYSQHDGYETVKRWIGNHTGLSAIFCASDTLAMGALLALDEKDIRVPEEFSIVGFDGLPFSRYLVPPLTTVSQPTQEKGKQAAKMLIDQIEGRQEKVVQKYLEPVLTVRGSTGKVL
jgi:LacI family transcriptional regulator